MVVIRGFGFGECKSYHQVTKLLALEVMVLWGRIERPKMPEKPKKRRLSDEKIAASKLNLKGLPESFEGVTDLTQYLKAADEHIADRLKAGVEKLRALVHLDLTLKNRKQGSKMIADLQKILRQYYRFYFHHKVDRKGGANQVKAVNALKTSCANLLRIIPSIAPGSWSVLAKEGFNDKFIKYFVSHKFILFRDIEIIEHTPEGQEKAKAAGTLYINEEKAKSLREKCGDAWREVAGIIDQHERLLSFEMKHGAVKIDPLHHLHLVLQRLDWALRDTPTSSITRKKGKKFEAGVFLTITDISKLFLRHYTAIRASLRDARTRSEWTTGAMMDRQTFLESVVKIFQIKRQISKDTFTQFNKIDRVESYFDNQKQFLEKLGY